VASTNAARVMKCKAKVISTLSIIKGSIVLGDMLCRDLAVPMRQWTAASIGGVYSIMAQFSWDRVIQ
jgi:hypothetical protein